MTIAEIRGKLSSSGSNISDRREDLLTADVFGCLRYLPFDKGFRKILTKARRCFIDGDVQRLCIKDANRDGKVRFWPRLKKSEPDVLIEHGAHLIMIEVKYLSPKLGSNKAEQDIEDNMEAACSDQLAREYQDLMGYAGDYTGRSLIYLTAHRSLPKEDVVSGYQELMALADSGCDDYKDNVYWLSWYEVYKTVSGLLKEENKYWRIVLCDIQRLLHRKGLRQFEGFDGIIGKVAPITAFYKRKPRRITWNARPVEAIEPPVFYRSKQ